MRVDICFHVRLERHTIPPNVSMVVLKWKWNGYTKIIIEHQLIDNNKTQSSFLEVNVVVQCGGLPPN